MVGATATAGASVGVLALALGLKGQDEVLRKYAENFRKENLLEYRVQGQKE